MAYFRVRLPTITALALLVAGCASGSESSGPAGAAPQGGSSGEVGAISALVSDDERVPLEGATVALVDLNRTETSDAGGHVVFAKVPVGPHRVNVTKGGYHPLDRAANVSAGQTTVVALLLVALPSDVAFHETFPFAGVQQCMVYTSVFLASCSFPYTAVYGNLHQRGVNLSNYGAPSDVLKNQYRYNFTVRPDHTGIVSELTWTAGSDAAKYYVLQVSCPWYDPTWDDCLPPGQTAPSVQGTYARARGVNPLRIEWKHEKPTWLPWVMSRAYLSGPVDRPAGVALDQKVEMYNTVFYGAPVPRDWSYFTTDLGKP